MENKTQAEWKALTQELFHLKAQGNMLGKGVELAFEIIRNHPDINERSRATVVLCNSPDTGIAKKILAFLDDNQDLPLPIGEKLRTNAISMVEN